MVAIKDFASNSVMGVVRKVVNYLCDTLTPKVDGAIDHLPARFNGTFNDSSRVLTMTIESQGTSTENLTAEVTIPAGGGSGGPTYSAGNGITITPENAIEIDTAVTATKQSVDTLQGQVGDAFSQVAIGADGKSLDFTALDGQVNNIVLPNNGGSGLKTLQTASLSTFITLTDNILSINKELIINIFYNNATTKEIMPGQVINVYEITKYATIIIPKGEYEANNYSINIFNINVSFVYGSNLITYRIDLDSKDITATIHNLSSISSSPTYEYNFTQLTTNIIPYSSGYYYRIYA